VRKAYGQKPTGKKFKTVRVPVQYELLVKNYICGLIKVMPWLVFPIELKQSVIIFA